MKLKMKRDLPNINMKKLFRRNQIIVTTLVVMIAAAGYLNYAGKKLPENEVDVYEAGASDISQEDILAENQRVLDAAGGYEEIESLDQDWDQIEEAESVADSGEVSAQPEGGMISEQIDAIENNIQPEGDGAMQLAQADADPITETISADAGTEEGDLTGLENPGEAILTSGMSVSDYIAGVQLSREQVRARSRETLLNIINNTNIEEAAKQEAIQNMIELTEIAEKENAAETLLMAKGFSDPVVSITDGKVDVVINAASITDPQRAQIEDVVKRKTEVGAENIIITLLNLEE